MKKNKDYFKVNGLTGPVRLANSVNLLCRKLAANGIHGTLYFMDENVETKHNLLPSSLELEIVLKTRQHLMNDKIQLATDLAIETLHDWDCDEVTYCMCMPHFRMHTSYVDLFCPKLEF